MSLVQCLRLHEEIAECRRLGIARRRREHHFGIGGDFDGAPRPCTIGDAHPAQLDVVFGRYRYLGMGVEVVIAAAKFDTPFGKNHLVAPRWFQSRLVCRRPEFTGGHIAQVTEAAPVVARAVFAPSGHREVLPATAAATGVGDHDVVTAVRQQLHFRDRRVGSGEYSHRHLRRFLRRTDLGKFGRMRVRAGCPWNSLLEQQHRRLEQRVGLEAPLHRATQQQMRQGKQAHPLVMGHERANDGTRFSAPQS